MLRNVEGEGPDLGAEEMQYARICTVGSHHTIGGRSLRASVPCGHLHQLKFHFYPLVRMPTNHPLVGI